MDFLQARSEYLRLRHAYRSGQITPEEFEKKVNAMVIRTTGQTWMIGVSSGKWYRRDGSQWVEDTPELISSVPEVLLGKKAISQALENTNDAKPGKTKSHAPARSGKPFNKLVTGVLLISVALLLVVAGLTGLMLSGLVATPPQLSEFISALPFAPDGEHGSVNIPNAETTSTGEHTTLSLSLTTQEPAQTAQLLAGIGADLLYSQKINGVWQQRHPSLETLVFGEDGSLEISSGPGNYVYSGNYAFSDDHSITFQLDTRALEAVIWIEDEIMSLEINGIESIYDRLK